MYVLLEQLSCAINVCVNCVDADVSTFDETWRVHNMTSSDDNTLGPLSLIVLL